MTRALSGDNADYTAQCIAVPDFPSQYCLTNYTPAQIEARLFYGRQLALDHRHSRDILDAYLLDPASRRLFSRGDLIEAINQREYM